MTADSNNLFSKHVIFYETMYISSQFEAKKIQGTLFYYCEQVLKAFFQFIE
jgi:hypothetical protein